MRRGDQAPAVGRLIRPDAAGTPERDWRVGLRRVATCRLDPDRIVVVAPHPDDETLGAGGVLATAARLGGAPSVVLCTDGEAAYVGEGLASTRVAETRLALRRLGGGTAIDVVRLGLPDGQVGAHHRRLRVALADAVAGAALVISPWEGDGHPDHEAVGEACVAICRASGQSSWRYPVWAWHWSSPDRLPPPRQMVRVALSGVAFAAKLDALGCFRSQADGRLGPPVLSDAVLEHFRRPYETFVVGQ